MNMESTARLCGGFFVARSEEKGDSIPRRPGMFVNLIPAQDSQVGAILPILAGVDNDGLGLGLQTE